MKIRTCDKPFFMMAYNSSAPDTFSDIKYRAKSTKTFYYIEIDNIV